MKTTAITVLLVDDHRRVREAIRTALALYPTVQVIAEASNGIDALLAVQESQPIVVLMDVNMPQMNGIEATRRIKTHYPHVAIVGMSVNADKHLSRAMKEAGATKLVAKDRGVEELHTEILNAAGKLPQAISSTHLGRSSS